jgi:hypothetical protein
MVSAFLEQFVQGILFIRRQEIGEGFRRSVRLEAKNRRCGGVGSNDGSSPVKNEDHIAQQVKNSAEIGGV